MNVLEGSILEEIKKWRNTFVHLPDYFVPRSQEENVTKQQQDLYIASSNCSLFLMNHQN